MKNQRQSTAQPSTTNQTQQPYYHNIKSERECQVVSIKSKLFTLDQSSSPVGNFGMNQGVAPSTEVLPNSYPITSHSQVSQFFNPQETLFSRHPTIHIAAC